MKFQLFIAVVFLIPIFITLGAVVFYTKKYKKGKRSPITGSLLRSPGESLRNELESNLEKLENAFFRVLYVSFLPLLGLFILLIIQKENIQYWQLAIIFALYVFLIFWQLRKIIALLKIRFNLRLGLDAEIAAGQELNQLMLDGCPVFHDFPAENFNIDHVVIGPGGVYAVETKGRAKPDKGRGKIDANVIFDGKKLQFPGWFETKPLEQAKRQADWLSKWLSSAVGSPIKAQGVLILPGWFVERKGAGQVMVISGKEAYHLKKSGRNTLVPEMIQRITHQVEQRCRNVEPAAYRK